MIRTATTTATTTRRYFPRWPNARCCFQQSNPTKKFVSTTVSSSWNRFFMVPWSSSDLPTSHEYQQALDHTVQQVWKYDPAGYLPGRLLPTSNMQLTYFAVRSFWVETGLRFGTTALIPSNSKPSTHLEWWSEGINAVFQENTSSPFLDHPTLRLLHHLINVKQIPLSKCHFENLLQSRKLDLDVKQYPTLESLQDHALLSCGSLIQLVLQSHEMQQKQNNDKDTSLLQVAAKHVGTCHGLANSLRLSIPIVSTTGKLILPHDLCIKHGVKSPRYLLSALGQGDGDGTCHAALQHVVRDIMTLALEELELARQMRSNLLTHYPTDGPILIRTFLPILASETFLHRLSRYQYDLTNQDLRRVSILEHATCAKRIILASYQQQY